MNKEIKYIDYTGEWPSLCCGTLIVSIDGQETHFGPEYYSWLDGDFDNDEEALKIKYYPSFWLTGGSVWFDEDYDSHIETGPWYYDDSLNNFPEFDKEDVEKLIELFNNNVPHGCCGGCI